MADINLLSQDARTNEKKTKVAKILRLVGVCSILVSIVLSGIVLLLFLTTKQSVSNATAKVVALERDVAANQSKVDSAITLVAKFSQLQKILKNGPRYSILLLALSQKVPADMNIKELTVTSPTKVNISGDSPSYLSLSQFLQVLTSDQTSIFSEETLQSVTLDSQTGRVQFVLLVTLKDQSLIT